jgi:starvation-inducible DNA-binding protein
MGPNDFLTGLMEDHEKMAWMLRSFLEGKSSGRSR